METSFYVVSKASADDKEYIGAIVFNANDTDNEAGANEYATELATLKPWQSHSVISAEDFANAYSSPDDETSNAVVVDDNGTD